MVYMVVIVNRFCSPFGFASIPCYKFKLNRLVTKELLATKRQITCFVLA
jgi:hypothetical protein